MDDVHARFLGVQVLEKLLRIERLLNSAKGTAAADDAVRAFRGNLGQIRQDLHRAMACLRPVEEETPPLLWGPVLRTFNSCLTKLTYLHTHLGYLAGPLAIPETKSFLQGLLSTLPLTPGAKRPTVIYSDVYMFEEADLVRYLGFEAAESKAVEEEVPALFLPKAEAENPLLWAILVHEMGHTQANPLDQILDAAELSRLEGEDGAAGREICANWAGEIFADLFSLHLLGPAYLAAFCDFNTVLGPEERLEEASVTHPFPRMRVCLMNDVLVQREIVAEFKEPLFDKWTDLGRFFYAFFEAMCDLQSDLSGEDPSEYGTFPLNIRRFRNEVDGSVGKLVPAIPPFDQARFSVLRDRLRIGVPIASVSGLNAESTVEEAMEALKVARKAAGKASTAQGKGTEALRLAQEHVEETPCTIAEIINAGWLFKCEQIYAPMIRRMHQLTQVDEDRFERDLRTLDAILRNSIETAHLHQLLVEEYE